MGSNKDKGQLEKMWPNTDKGQLERWDQIQIMVN